MPRPSRRLLCILVLLALVQVICSIGSTFDSRDRMDDADTMRAALVTSIPPGASVDLARARMEKRGFRCSELGPGTWYFWELRANGNTGPTGDFLGCGRDDASTSVIPGLDYALGCWSDRPPILPILERLFTCRTIPRWPDFATRRWSIGIFFENGASTDILVNTILIGP